MIFYDANLSFGVNINVEKKPHLPCKPIDDLQTALKRAGVRGGLVWAEAADMAGAVTGNALLENALSNASSDLFGMYTLMPSCTHEIPGPAALPTAMKKGRFAALRLAPETHQYLAKPQVLGDYLKMACDRKIPVVFDTAYGITISEVYEIMEHFPDLTAILANHNIWPSDRYDRTFLSRFKNLRMELSASFNAMELEALVRQYGCTRFLYGSRFPAMYMGGIMLMLRHADISEKDKQMIAGENLLSMIREATYE